jgi:short subunit dehydrogenase-like uncharacterized protein
MPEHLKDGLIAHFSLLAVSHKRLTESHKTHQEEMKALERRQEEEMKTMRGKINKLKKQTEHLISNVRMIFPIDFRVENAQKCMVTNPWSSIPFYSQSQGYKLQTIFYRSVFIFAVTSCGVSSILSISSVISVSSVSSVHSVSSVSSVPSVISVSRVPSDGSVFSIFSGLSDSICAGRSLLNQQPQHCDCEFNIELKFREPLGEEL